MLQLGARGRRSRRDAGTPRVVARLAGRAPRYVTHPRSNASPRFRVRRQPSPESRRPRAPLGKEWRIRLGAAARRGARMMGRAPKNMVCYSKGNLQSSANFTLDVPVKPFGPTGLRFRI